MEISLGFHVLEITAQKYEYIFQVGIFDQWHVMDVIQNVGYSRHYVMVPMTIVLEGSLRSVLVKSKRQQTCIWAQLPLKYLCSILESCPLFGKMVPLEKYSFVSNGVEYFSLCQGMSERIQLPSNFG